MTDIDRTHEPLPVVGEPLPEGEEAPPRGVQVMALVRWLLIFGLAAAAVYTIGAHFELWGAPQKVEARYHCPMHPSVVSDRPGECPICGMGLTPIEEGHKPRMATGFAYECPIHPEYGSQQPGECPVCGEKLRPTGLLPPPRGLTSILLPPERIQRIGVRTAVVAREQLVHRVRTVGYATADESRVARVQTRYAGWIERLFVGETGVLVKEGQPLAAIFSNELYLAQVEHLHSIESVKRAVSPEMREVQESLVRATRKRLRLLGIAGADIEALEKSRKPQRAMILRSPVSGHVLQKTAVLGVYLQPGTELFTITDLSRVWMMADVYERDLPFVRVRQAAKVRLAAHPGRSFHGRVALLYPTVVDATRTLKARIELDNPRLLLRPGMYGHVELATVRRKALVVPSEAVVETGEHSYAFVAHPDGTLEPRSVAVGLRVGDKIEVRKGLRSGERVVTSANFLIDSESRIRAAIERMGAKGEPPPVHKH